MGAGHVFRCSTCSMPQIPPEGLSWLQALYNGLYTEQNVAISGINTHSGPGGYLQYVLYDVTSLGFVQESYDALVLGILEVSSAVSPDPCRDALVAMGVLPSPADACCFSAACQAERPVDGLQRSSRILVNCLLCSPDTESDRTWATQPQGMSLAMPTPVHLHRGLLSCRVLIKQ